MVDSINIVIIMTILANEKRKKEDIGCYEFFFTKIM